MAPTLGSALTLTLTALAGKLFLRTCQKEVKVEGLPILLDALRARDSEDAFAGRGRGKDEGKAKAKDFEGRVGEAETTGSFLKKKEVAQSSLESGRRKQGVITICNHNSVMDDPLMWSVMPLTNYFPFARPSWTSHYNRWTLGAKDIMFTNPWFSAFFTAGQVVNTERGGGVYQPAIDEAIQLLQQGEWIHIFPEGKVIQKKVKPEGGLLRFKWGVGRILMDSEVMPEIIPVWISGFDQIMPETRTFPRFLPRVGNNISITVGQPITRRIAPLIDSWRALATEPKGTIGAGGTWDPEGVGSLLPDEQRETRARVLSTNGREEEMRKRITSELRLALQDLGQYVERKEGRFERGEWSHSKTGMCKDQA